MSTNSAPASAVLMPPHGLDEVISTFGDIFALIRPDHTLDPSWQNEFLDRVQLPFPLPLSWDISRTVRQFTCHRLLVPIFTRVFDDLQNAGLQSKLTSFGGLLWIPPAANRNQALGPFVGNCDRFEPGDEPAAGPLGEWIQASWQFFARTVSNGEEGGREKVAILCTFNTAPDIKKRLLALGRWSLAYNR